MNGKVALDAELLASWADGSRVAGNELIERHFEVVFRFFGNKVDHHDVEDLVQQTFLACVEGRHRYEERATFVTFLLGIARNKLFNFYKTKRRTAVDFSISSVRDIGASPSSVVARQEEQVLLMRALQAIPLEAQTILELAYWEGFDGGTIASIMAIPLNTAYSRLRRARDALRERLLELAPDRGSFERAAATLGQVLPTEPNLEEG